MYFEIARKEFHNPLKTVVSVVEQRQTLPILANVLIQVQESTLRLTATDAEVEVSCFVPLEPGLGGNEGEITIPARKLLDIVKSLDERNPIQVNIEDSKAVVKSGKSKFTLSCLPAEDYPASQEVEGMLTFSLPQRVLKDLLAQVVHAMATNDVRYYLNGVCLDLLPDKLALVATDGHRLALATHEFDLGQTEPLQVIIPRKAVVELTRLLENVENNVDISVNNNHVRFKVSESLTLSSKLIDGKFPDYVQVLPLHANKIIVADVGPLRAALAQAAILSNEKFKGVRFSIDEGKLTVSARNSDQEESEIEIEVDYADESLEIGFNVTYIDNALSVVSTEEVEVCFTDTNSSCLIKPKGVDTVKFVIMPMRL